MSAAKWFRAETTADVFSLIPAGKPVFACKTKADDYVVFDGIRKATVLTLDEAKKTLRSKKVDDRVVWCRTHEHGPLSQRFVDCYVVPLAARKPPTPPTSKAKVDPEQAINDAEYNAGAPRDEDAPADEPAGAFDHDEADYLAGFATLTYRSSRDGKTYTAKATPAFRLAVSKVIHADRVWNDYSQEYDATGQYSPSKIEAMKRVEETRREADQAVRAVQREQGETTRYVVHAFIARCRKFDADPCRALDNLDAIDVGGFDWSDDAA